MVSNQSMSSPPPEAAALSPGQREAALREIVVFIDGHTKAGGILEFAGELAEEHGARLIGVFLQPEPTITPEETFTRGTGMLRVSSCTAHNSRGSTQTTELCSGTSCVVTDSGQSRSGDRCPPSAATWACMHTTRTWW